MSKLDLAKVSQSTLDQIQAERSRRSLRTYVEQAWSVLEPGTPFLNNWHISAIADHLQAVSKGQIKRLIINLPPRMLKSVTVSVMWPTWTWIDDPYARFIFASFSSTLSRKHSLDRRSVIQSDWYQKRWGHLYTLNADHNTMEEFENDKRGVMIASSVGGPPFGKGASCIVCDDILDPEAALSDAERERSNRFFDQVLCTRLNNPATGSICVVMQRLGELDLTGYIQKSGSGWDTLILPMEFDGHRSVSSLGWKDPRTVEGELLHPARIDEVQVSNLKRMGSQAFAAMYQQRPAPLEGGMFKRHWWRYWKPAGVDMPPVMVRFPDGKMTAVEAVDLPNSFDEETQSWDFAFKDTNASDFVAGTAWGRLGADKYVLDLVNEKLDFTASLKAMEDMIYRHPKAAAKYVEDKANGSAIVSSLRHKFSGIIATNPEGGKVARAASVTPQVESGNVYLPHPALFPWVDVAIKQLSDFPNAAHDDIVDAFSQNLIKMGASEYGKLLPEFSRASHIVTNQLKPWWNRWVALYWGVQESCAIWFCTDDKKRVNVYRELLTSSLSAEDFAAEVARQSVGDLASLSRLTAWTLEDYFEGGAGTKTIVQRFVDGFTSVLGNESSFIWAFNEGERSLGSEMAYASLSARRKQAASTKITLQHAKGEYMAAWEHLRHLARTSPSFRRPDVEYDRDFALQLLSMSDGNRKLQQYMEAVEGGVKEVLPKFFVADACPSVGDALSSAARSEKRPKELSETPYASILNAMAFGLLAHREDVAKMPKEEFLSERLNSVHTDDVGKLVMVARKAEADYKHQNRVQPINFRRRAGGGRR